MKTSVSVSYLIDNTSAIVDKCVHNVLACVLLLCVSVVSAEVVDTSSTVSDFVFPESPSQLDNFTSVDVNDTVQITIPAGALTTLTEETGGSGQCLVNM